MVLASYFQLHIVGPSLFIPMVVLIMVCMDIILPMLFVPRYEHVTPKKGKAQRTWSPPVYREEIDW